MIVVGYWGIITKEWAIVGCYWGVPKKVLINMVSENGEIFGFELVLMARKEG